MISINDVGGILAARTPVHGTDGKIGNVGQVFLDDTSGDPTWITVHTGLFGGKESFVPLEGATYQGDQVDVPFSKEQVKDAPRLDTGANLSPEQENELFAYYGIDEPYEDGWDRRPEAQGGDSTMQREASPAEFVNPAAEPVAATPAAAAAPEETSGVASPEQMITGTEEPIAGTDPSAESVRATSGAGVIVDEGPGSGSSVDGWSVTGSTLDDGPGSGASVSDSMSDSSSGVSLDEGSGTDASPSDGSVAAEPAAPTGRVRLRRYVVTETYADDGRAVTTEDIHIERDPDEPQDAQTDGGSDDPDGGPGRHARP